MIIKHTLKLRPIYFDLIKSGEKTVEVRLDDEKRQNFKKNDIITFYKEPDLVEKFDAIIINRIKFNSFEELLNSVDKKDIGFKDKTKKEVIDAYHEFYTVDEEKKYGVVAFFIKKI